MTLDPQTEQQIRRFLLGEFDATHSRWDAESVEMVETDLIDEYLRRDLAPDERRQFESYFLQQPGNRRKVQMAAAFHRSLQAANRRGRRIGISFGLAAASVVAAVGYWQGSTMTLYPGGVRETGDGYSTVRRVLPKRIRLALVDPLPAGKARAILRNPVAEVWNTDLEIAPEADYVTIPLPTWRIPKGSYRIELQAFVNGEFRTAGSYRITVE